MNKYKKITKTALLAVLAILANTSCQDWLTIYPQTQIVEENFWEDKNDLEGVRYGAYKQMCNTLEKIVLWGDLRSDSYILSSSDKSTSTQEFYSNLRQGRIERDSANTYFDWSGFYTTINYCNKVLYHGGRVQGKDPQFTPSEWSQMRAEMTALRALNYFYLLRAFKDIPYTTKVINKDTEVEYFSATNQLVVLDSLIADVETIKGQATNRYTNIKDTKGLITNTAIYALLSDLYLWRASLHQGRGIDEDVVYITNVSNTSRIRNIQEDENGPFVRHSVADDYQACIEYADKSLEELAEQTRRNNEGFGNSRLETINYGLTNCDLIKNDYDNFKERGSVQMPAYTHIFSQGNSDESIFELQFNKADTRSNGVVTAQWGYGDYVHLATSSNAIRKIYSGIDPSYDSRTWFSMWKKVITVNGQIQNNDLPSDYIFKWRNATFITPQSAKASDVIIGNSGEGDDYRNWIIYRMSDVMLQKAEALAAMSKSVSDANGKEALRIVNALHRRWYCPDIMKQDRPLEDVTDAAGALFYSSSNTKTVGNIPSCKTAEIAVMNERQIEFIGEGKRWFDLVRYAERHAGGKDGTQDVREWTEENQIGNGKAGVDDMVDNFMSITLSTPVAAALKNHMKNRYGLYNLIYYMEIKASVDENGVQHLEQNPVWNKSLYD